MKDFNTILDNITKYVGDYIAKHANRNELLTCYDSIEKIDDAIKNIDNTLNSIDDKELSDNLKKYKRKKEEEKRTIMNDLMYKILPKQPVINMKDYIPIKDDKGEHLILKNVDDSFIDITPVITSSKQKEKKKVITKTTSEYYDSYSGGCGNTYGSPIRYGYHASGGC